MVCTLKERLTCCTFSRLSGFLNEDLSTTVRIGFPVPVTVSITLSIFRVLLRNITRFSLVHTLPARLTLSTLEGFCFPDLPAWLLWIYYPSAFTVSITLSIFRVPLRNIASLPLVCTLVESLTCCTFPTLFGGLNEGLGAIIGLPMPVAWNIGRITIVENELVDTIPLPINARNG